MPLTAVTRSGFAGRRWRPHHGFAFARDRGLVELSAAELPAAACAFPVGFLARPEGPAVPVALLGIDDTRNLYIARDGSWLGSYIPAVFRAAPFTLGLTPEGERILCVDDSLSLADDDDQDALEFFEPGGEPAAAVLRAQTFLTQFDLNREATARACTSLQEAGLLQPWPIAVPLRDGTRHIEGLLRVEEPALDALAALPLHGLLASGALAVAYCQLISMQHVAKLGQLADAHAALAESGAGRPPGPGTGAAPDLSFMQQQDDTLSFGDL